MREAYSEHNLRACGHWIQKPSRTIGSQIVFSQNSNFVDRRLKYQKYRAQESNRAFF
jgi:hypothetical protein